MQEQQVFFVCSKEFTKKLLALKIKNIKVKMKALDFLSKGLLRLWKLRRKGAMQTLKNAKLFLDS